MGSMNQIYTFTRDNKTDFTFSVKCFRQIAGAASLPPEYLDIYGPIPPPPEYLDIYGPTWFNLNTN